MIPAITLEHGSKSEKRLRTLLLELFQTHTLDKWRYADAVHIKDNVIPHSHPILTLSPKPRYLGQPEHVLAIYLHEQSHWFEVQKDVRERSDQAKAVFKQRYPDLPLERAKGGCGSERSNLLHIIINFLEHQALSELLGRARADEILQSHPYYQAINRVLFADFDAIAQIIAHYDLLIPERPPQEKIYIELKPLEKGKK